MSINSVLEITGLSHAVADAGIPISSLPVISGSKGIVTDFSIIWGADGLPPSDGFITLQGYPYVGGGAVAVGTDSLGSIGVAKSFTLAFPPGDDDTQWNTTGGTVVLANGFWASDVRVFVNTTDGTRRIRIDILVLELSDLTESLVRTPENLIDSDVAWDPVEGEGNTDLNWTFDNALAEDPDGFAIIRDGAIIGTVPWVNGVTDYSYTDYVNAEGTYSYDIRTYKYGTPNVMSPASGVPVDVIFGGATPDISVTSDMALALDWNSTLVFITDPSGIYGLIPNKTHDTLYNRSTETSIDVKIPDPFVKLAFLPEE